jgi:stage III sporulation protein AG
MKMFDLGKITDRLKEYYRGNDKKKLIESSVIFIIIGIIIVIAAGSFMDKGNRKDTGIANNDNKKEDVVKDYSQNEISLEEKVEDILSKIEGAGRVDVLITYASGKELVPVYDTKSAENNTEEKDSGNGMRSIKQYDNERAVAYEESQNGIKKPVVAKEVNPEVRGVLVVADGAENDVVREKLVMAVQALVDVPAYRVQVFRKSRNAGN